MENVDNSQTDELEGHKAQSIEAYWHRNEMFGVHMALLYNLSAFQLIETKQILFVHGEKAVI